MDANKLQQDFPLLRRKINGKSIIYLDSAATSLKPQEIIDKENEYYTRYTANIFRGIYTLSEEATAAYESVREKTAKFIKANSTAEIIFTRNSSESINLVYYSWASPSLKAGDEIVVSVMEHHSNFVPWQQLGIQQGVKFNIWQVNQEGKLDLSELDKLITPKTKLLAITAVSNVLGTINPIKEIVKLVKSLSPQCLVLVDAAQTAPHMPIDVLDWGADLVVFSSHKMLGPTGVGVLWGRREVLETFTPFMYGGEMISEVYPDHTLFKQLPYRFEAGTPHIAGVIGFGAALDYLTKLGLDNVRQHEIEITTYALKSLKSLKSLNIYGPEKSADRAGVIAFTIKSVHAHDVAQVLDEDNICIRSGNHCAMPLHLALGIPATARASFYIYTTKADIDALMIGLEKVNKIFA